MVELDLATSCPECGSTDIRTKAKYTRKVRTLHGIENVAVQQHCCRKCQMTFTDGVRGVKKGCQIEDNVKRLVVNAYVEGPDMEGVKRRLIEDLSVSISISTIWRAVSFVAKSSRGIAPLEDLLSPPSKYACVDEKFISAHGKKKPQLFAICPETNLPLLQKLLRNREEPAITSVAKALKKMGILVGVTDDFKTYAPALKVAGLRHQKCHFHAIRAAHRAMKKAHIQKKRRKKFVGWIRNFLRSKTLKEARSWLRVIGRMRAEKKLKRFLKSFLFDWKDYFTYLEYPGCPKTSNAVEQFNRRFEQKYQSMHGFRKERTARSFTSLFTLHSMFRKFESGNNKGRSPLEIAGIQLAANSIFDILPH